MGKITKNRDAAQKNHRASNATTRGSGGGGGRGAAQSQCYCYSPECASCCGGSCSWPGPNSDGMTAETCNTMCQAMGGWGLCTDSTISGCIPDSCSACNPSSWTWQGIIQGYTITNPPHHACPTGQAWIDGMCQSPYQGGDYSPDSELLGFVYFTTDYDSGQQVCMQSDQVCTWDVNTTMSTQWDPISCCIAQGYGATNWSQPYGYCDSLGFPGVGHSCFSGGPRRSGGKYAYKPGQEPGELPSCGGPCGTTADCRAGCECNNIWQCVPSSPHPGTGGRMRRSGGTRRKKRGRRNRK